MLTLGQAAREANVSKATIHRAIKGGKLSAGRPGNGAYEIDPAELSRVYGFAKPLQPPGARQGATGGTPAETGGVPALQARVAILEAELAAERRRASTAETDRDRWHEQAQRALLADRQARQPERRGLFGFLRRAG